MRTHLARELGMIAVNNLKLRPEVKYCCRRKVKRNFFPAAPFCRFLSWVAIPSVRQIITFLIVVLLISCSNSNLRAETSGNEEAWSTRLGELNYLIMKTSAVNIIYGLNLTQEQAVLLSDLSRRIDDASPPPPEMKGTEYQETAKLRDSFAKFFEHILHGRPISDAQKKSITTQRLREVEIIKKSLIGAQGFIYSGKGCLACHASPDKFPAGDISEYHLPQANVTEQERIDRAHLKGMFGAHGTMRLWEVKSEIDKILTGTQRYMMRSMQCSLLPPDYLAHPTRIGQAVLTGNWYSYFQEVRAVPEKQWMTYQNLYTRYPFQDMLLALSPGLAEERRNEIEARMTKIVEQARLLDDIDYTLERKELVAAMNQEIESVTKRYVETDQQQEARQLRTAMFLLFPGNSKIYDEYIRRMNSK